MAREQTEREREIAGYVTQQPPMHRDSQEKDSKSFSCGGRRFHMFTPWTVSKHWPGASTCAAERRG